MKFLRNLILTVVTTAALMAPLASQPAAAHPPQPQQHHPHPGHHRVYWVYYRSSPASPWVAFGGYHHESQARQAVNYYRFLGYDAFFR